MSSLKEEADAVGFYLSGHPLDDYARSLERLDVKRYSDVVAAGKAGPVKLAGTVINRKERTSSKGSRFSFVRFTDTSGTFEVTVFSEVLEVSRHLLEAGRSLLIKANAQIDGDSVRFTTDGFEALDAAVAGAGALVKVRVASAECLAPLSQLLTGEQRGKGRIKLEVDMDGTADVEIDLPGRFALTPATLRALREVPGIGRVEEV